MIIFLFFGKKVNDFLKLDYKSLYCLNIKATQELNLKVKSLEERLLILENRLNIIDNN